jgi:hypothetical protein
VKELFNIKKLLHCKFKRHETKLIHPSSLKAFQGDQKRDLKHFDSMDVISTKQNKTKQKNQFIA